VPSAPAGHAVVMLQSSGQNSIVIVGGANMSCWPQILPPQHLEVVSSAGIVLLQREIPDFVNVQVAKVGTLHFLLRKWEIVLFSFTFY
jgi:ribokinase